MAYLQRMHHKIFIVGFMCSGKTTVGRQLAKELNLSFFDTDEMVEELTGMKIKEIFSKWGEKYFRRMERDVIYGLMHRQESFVCATGGGAVCQPDVMDWLNRIGKTAWLHIDWDLIQDRLSQDTTRPLTRLSLIELKALFEDRKKYYSKAAETYLSIEELIFNLKK